MEQNILDITNPVYDTARMTLSNLGLAGVKEAAEFAKMLGLTGYAENYGVNSENDVDMVNAVIQEFRFNFLNHYIRSQGARNVLDIACGFSPRGIIISREGYNYVGADLEAAVNALANVTGTYEVRDGCGTLDYKLIDVTNPDALYSGCEGFDGAVTIVCEGLFMYLQDYEVTSFCEGLKRVLSKHGGAFVTPDFSTMSFYGCILQTFLGEAEGKAFLDGMAEKIFSKSDTNGFESLARADDEAAYRFFTARGLTVERIPFYDPAAPDELNVFSRIDSDKKAQLIEKLSHIYGWRVTYSGGNEVSTSRQGYCADYTCSDGTIRYRIAGRLDSVTATDFMEMYEKSKSSEDFSLVQVDLADAEYISSAGLRVLLRMKKVHGRVQVLNVSEDIMEIFRTTGFDSILDFA